MSTTTVVEIDGKKYYRIEDDSQDGIYCCSKCYFDDKGFCPVDKITDDLLCLDVTDDEGLHDFYFEALDAGNEPTKL